MALARIPLFGNPIFQRDFLALCKLKRWFAIRSLVLAAFAIIPSLFYLGMGYEVSTGNLDEIGRVLFATACWIQIVCVAILTPGMVADVVVAERRRDALEILLTTPLRPSGIVLGKLFARLSLLIVIFVAAIPLVSISLLFGGVRGAQVIGLAQISFGTMFLLAGPSLYLSVVSRRLGTAAVLSYVLPFVFFILVMPLSFWALPDKAALRFLSTIHPVFVTTTVSFPEVAGFVGARVGTPFHYLLVGIGVCAVTAFLAVHRLAREKRDRGMAAPKRSRRLRPDRPRSAGRGSSAVAPEGPTAGAASPAVPATVGHEATTAPPPEPSVDRRALRARLRRRRWFRGMKNPMLWKEAHLVNSTHSRVLSRILIALFLLSEACLLLFIPVHSLLRDAEIHLVVIGCATFVILVLAAVNGATSIVTERQQGTLELIRVTLLTPREITFAKIAGTARSVAPLLFLTLLHILLAGAFTELGPTGIVTCSLALATVVTFFAVSGVRASVLAPTPTRAVLRAMGLLAFTTVGLGILCVFPLALRMDEEVAIAIFGANPISTVVGPAAVLNGGRMSSEDATFLTSAVVALAVYGGLALYRYFRLPSLYTRTAEGRHP